MVGRVQAKVKKTQPRFDPQSFQACKRDLMLLEVHVCVREAALINHRRNTYQGHKQFSSSTVTTDTIQPHYDVTAS